MTPLDRWLFGRVAGAVLAGVLVVAGLIAATDEASSTLGMRLARLAALGPVISALAVFGVTAHARARGELRAVEALGQPPWRAARGAASAGLMAGALLLLLLALPGTDPASLFPVLPRLGAWELGEGGRLFHGAGVVIEESGRILIGAHLPVAQHPARPGAVSALLCLGPLALLAPGWAVTPMHAAVRAPALLATSALAVVLLHGVAAAATPAILGLFAVAPLAVTTWMVRRRG